MKLQLTIYSLLTFVITTNAWWDMGHYIVAMITSIEMKEKHPIGWENLNDLIKLYYGELTHNQIFTFVDSALASQMHYIDIPLIRDGAVPKNNGLVQNISFAIVNLLFQNNCQATLRSNKGIQSWETAFCTWALVHFYGDAHQPLHVSNLYSKDFPNGDEGGNEFIIKYPNTEIFNLHYLWDSMCDHQIDLVKVSFLYQPLNDTGMKILQDVAEKIMLAYTRESLQADLQKTLEQGISDTYNIANTFVYENIQPFQTPSEQYMEGCWLICQRQIALAGYRLTDFLVEVFDQKSQPNLKDQV